ncbi:MarR family transcriptional regulator [Sphaerisporangium krabiense]|uniref:DNA-binding MarR family transcriptional regulator n=1 Tax=Sphaerisporangium krabiense TaxID=763782 RepID=A0A7W8Z4S2_9ACTN|nr:MarR family transcriptional regulator [Sphaerisporangium krabiense]MBB5627409.1 DNA-binding MarR family transcriptional regulator [Sphaerisporangium krabiense]GII64454.1 MarR family transcriptional regulator [Sphaerisporangium krabiense]
MGFLIWHLSLRWRAAMDRALGPVGLTSSQYAVLATLSGISAEGKVPSQRELADFSGLEPMHVSKLVRGLEKAGLVTRAANPSDPRAVQLTVTAQGAHAVAEGRRVVLELEERRLAPLGGAMTTRSTELAETLLTLLRHTDEQQD